MSAQAYGPLREIVLDPVHRECIGDLLEEAAADVLTVDHMRCLCVDCLPNQITRRAWQIYWDRSKQ